MLRRLSPTCISKGLLSLDLQLQQQTRGLRVRKPPWVPRAKNKQFRVPPYHVQEPVEYAYMRPIWLDYMTKMRSIYQLFKTEVKFTDQQSLKVIEEQRLVEEEEKQLYEENNRKNEAVLAQQLRDQEAELGEKKRQAEAELSRRMEIEKRLVELADQRVRRMKELSKSFIDPKNLEMEIEKALNERKSYNFAIDQTGNIYNSNAS